MVSILERDVENIDSRTWGNTNLCAIAHSSTNVNNARCGDEAHISGFLHRAKFNVVGTGQRMHIYEYWIIPTQWKSDWTNAEVILELQDDFYTAHGQPAIKDRPWLNSYPSWAYSEPINSARFTVLKKKKWLLGPHSSTLNTQGTATYIESNSYIKLGRKYTYGTMGAEGGESGVNPIQPPVFYISFVIPVTEPALAAVIPTIIKRELHIVTYFRDAESGL